MSVALIIIFINALIFRVGSLVYSIRNEKRLKANEAIEYGKLNSSLLAVAHVLYYFGALAEGLWRGTQPSFWTGMGVALYIVSVIFLFLVWRELKGLWTVKVIIAPDHNLNQSALFRAVRHPNYYLNIIPELIGLAMIMGAWLILFVGLPLYLIVLRRRIVLEERVMKERFPQY